ncbi:MAG: dienelactone hydrolase family protein [Alphaproteobacteria bacterium]|nr:dienelactone hydrolase family protein [Alphaproteobacteria bacterium]
MTLNDYTIPPLNGKTSRAVIFLHGLGDRGDGGLLSLGQMWQPALPPDTECLCPDAPFEFDMAPPDFGGRQWFSLQNFTADSIAAGVKSAAPHLNAYIDHVMATRGLRPAQILLVGFSQGTMMALYTALRRAEGVAGIIGYSGLLVAGDSLPQEKRCAPPVLLVHGTADDVVPFRGMAEAEQGLRHAHIAVEAIACPGAPHTIDERGLAVGLQFAQRCFAAGA